MELLIKVYSDKPSRIGIKFIYGYKAVRSYEELIAKHRGETFSLKIEPVKTKLNLTLQSNESGIKIPYKDLDYKPDQFKKLEQLMNQKVVCEFVHIYSDANTLFVAKPFRRQEFISVTGFEMINCNE